MDRFVARNSDRVRRGGQFSQLTRGRADDDHPPRTAAGPGRRLPGRGHPAAGPQDRPQPGNHPLHAEAVRPGASRAGRFSPTITGRCALETKRKIYQQYHRGESVDALAKRFCRTRASIYRIIARDARAADLRVAAGLHPQRPVRPALRRQKRERRILGPMPASDEPTEEAAAARRTAPVPGQPVRGAAVDPRARRPTCSAR